MNDNYPSIHQNEDVPPESPHIQQPMMVLETDKNPGPLDHLKDGLAGQARTAFIGKVYILLTMELAVTFGICLISQYVEAYRQFQLNNFWLVAIPVVLMIVVAIVACCVPSARVFPFDMIMLLIFVLSFSYICSFICSVVVDNVDDSDSLIPIAIFATVAIALVLTIYSFLCKGNFLIWIGILLVVVAIALVIGISVAFTNIRALYYVYCSIIILIFGIYLVIITKSIIGGDIVEFPMDHPILASLFLYIYIMRIFLYILMILGAGRR